METIKNAIIYRLIKYTMGESIIHQWGYTEGTSGYQTSQEIFDKKYSLINFEEFQNEILISWMVKLIELKKEKKQMKDVLEYKDTNEEYRRSFCKIKKEVKGNYVRGELAHIDSRIIDSSDVLKENSRRIDDMFSKLMDQSFNTIGQKDKKEEIEQVLTSIEHLESLKEDFYLEHNIQLDDFINEILNPSLNKIEQSRFIKNEYNEYLRRLIKNKYNNYQYEKKKRAKHTILYRIENGTLGKISLLDFEDSYYYLSELYKIGVEDTRYGCIESWLNYYYFEKVYNVSFYIHLATILTRFSKKDIKKLMPLLSKLVVLDFNLYRTINLQKIINQMIVRKERGLEKIENEIHDLIQLRNKIVDDLILIDSINLDRMKEKVYESTKYAELMKIFEGNIKRIDIEEEHDNYKDIYAIVKQFLELNNDVITQRINISK